MVRSLIVSCFLVLPLFSGEPLNKAKSYASPQVLAGKNLFWKRLFLGTRDEENWGTPISICKQGKTWAVTDNTKKQVWLYQGKKLRALKPKGGWQSPADCLFSHQYLYITDPPAGKVWVYDLTKKDFHALDAPFGRPLGLCAYKEKVYITDVEKQVLWEVQGNKGKRWVDKGLNFPTDCIEVQGSLAIADSFNHRLVVLDAQGNETHAFGKAGDGMGAFSFIRGLAVDDKHRVYISDVHQSWIQVFSKEGKLLYVYGGEPLLNHPSYMAWDEGYLWVADTYGKRIVRLETK